jgi:nucleoside-diphosphate-sugar epimerase
MVRSIFLSGAGGFLGQRVLQRLAQKDGCRVVCLTRGDLPDSVPPQIRYVQGDLLDPSGYADALSGCDTVLHLAAATGKCPPDEYMRVNRDGTGALLEQARRSGVQRFLFVSSVAAKFQDQFRYYYGQSKQQAEALVAASELRWTIVRPTMIFGRNAPVFDSLARLAALPVVPVFGDGRTPVQPVYVDDLADCLVAMLSQEEGLDRTTVEIGGPEVLTIQDLLLRIRSSAGRPGGPVLHLPVNAISRCIGYMEPFLLSVLPFTAGQLASFSNPGTAAPHPWVAGRQSGMAGISEMLWSAINGHKRHTA